MNRDHRVRRAKGPKHLHEILAKSGQLKAGSVYVITIVHDDGCAILLGTGPCDCNPEVGQPARILSTDEN